MFYFALLSGITAKLYDDLKDNPLLKSLKNKYLLEILKLFHIASFIHVAFYDPLFLYIILICVFVNFISDNSAYKNVYETALVITILLFIPFLNKLNIKNIKLNSSFFVYFIIVLIGTYCEASVIKEEYSFRKLYIRIVGIILNSFGYFYFLSSFPTFSIVLMYVIGYLLVSVVVQIYCIFFVLYLNKIKKYIKKSIYTKNIKNTINALLYL